MEVDQDNKGIWQCATHVVLVLILFLCHGLGTFLRWMHSRECPAFKLNKVSIAWVCRLEKVVRAI